MFPLLNLINYFCAVTFQLSNIQAAKGELGKTREQLAEEKKIAMSIRVQPLNFDGMQPSQLRAKAEQMWNLIIKLETEKYDMEERMKRQDYDVSFFLILPIQS